MPRGGSADRIRQQERRAKVAPLLVAGLSIQDIAGNLNVHRATISRDVAALLKQWADEQKPADRDRWRALELEKLNRREARLNAALMRANWENIAVRDVLGAIDRIAERRARLLGIDAPERHEVAGSLSLDEHGHYRPEWIRQARELLGIPDIKRLDEAVSTNIIPGEVPGGQEQGQGGIVESPVGQIDGGGGGSPD